MHHFIMGYGKSNTITYNGNDCSLLSPNVVAVGQKVTEMSALEKQIFVC